MKPLSILFILLVAGCTEKEPEVKKPIVQIPTHLDSVDMWLKANQLRLDSSQKSLDYREKAIAEFTKYHETGKEKYFKRFKQYNDTAEIHSPYNK